MHTDEPYTVLESALQNVLLRAAEMDELFVDFQMKFSQKNAELRQEQEAIRIDPTRGARECRGDAAATPQDPHTDLWMELRWEGRRWQGQVHNKAVPLRQSAVTDTPSRVLGSQGLVQQPPGA